MAKSLKMPKCVRFNKHIWNSEPFMESFLYDLKGRKYYFLDEADCRTSLINLFSLLDFWTLQTENQASMRAILSSLCIMLAVNIRDSDCAPLVNIFDEDEFANDAIMSHRLEKPISKWSQVSEEIQNALRSVKRFDVVAPALAWAVVQFFVGQTPMTKVVELELDRWRRVDSKLQFPRGCVAFLERKLPLVKNFSFLPVDLATLVKATGVFFRTNAADPPSSSIATSSIKEQLVHLTRCFIEKKLGPWLCVEDISHGNLLCQKALIDSFHKLNNDPRLQQPVENLSLFYSNLAKQFDGFSLRRHHVYCVYSSRMLSYFCSSQVENAELCQKINRVKEVLSEIGSELREIDTLDVADDKRLPIESDVVQIAKSYLMQLPPEQRTKCCPSSTEPSSADATLEVSGADVKQVATKKKRRKKNKKNKLHS